MEQAQTAALDAANIDAADADISSATLSEVAGVTCYKVEFTSGNHTYAYSINSESGEVLEASYRDKNAAPTDSAQTDTTASGATTTPAQTTPNINTSTGAVDEAKAQGAIGLFTSKYGERVKVYTMGNFSKEICGGPHAANTGDLGTFRILKEESSSRGVRRIKAVLVPKQ